MPYQLAPPQSGSNGPSTPSYEVDPRVAFFGGRSARRRDVPPDWPGPASPGADDRRVPLEPAAPPVVACPLRPGGPTPIRAVCAVRRAGAGRPRPGRPPAVRRTARSGGAGRPGRSTTGPVRPWPRRRRAPAAAVGSSRRVAPVGIGVPRPTRRRRRSAPVPDRTGPTDQLLVGGLDRQEPRQRGLAGGVGVIRLGESPVGPLDLVERRAAGKPERAIRIGVEGHDVGPSARRAVVQAGIARHQPMSSPTGASSNSAIVSAPMRPWGSSCAGR